jgi:hypothetical protein
LFIVYLLLGLIEAVIVTPRVMVEGRRLQAMNTVSVLTSTSFQFFDEFEFNNLLKPDRSNIKEFRFAVYAATPAQRL